MKYLMMFSAGSAAAFALSRWSVATHSYRPETMTINKAAHEVLWCIVFLILAALFAYWDRREKN